MQVLAQQFHVGDEMPGRVVGQLRMRHGAPAAALVEQNDAVALRIEEAPRLRVAAGAGPAMHEYHRLALRIAAFLEIDPVQWRHLQEARIIGFDFGVERASRGGCVHLRVLRKQDCRFSIASAEKSHCRDRAPAKVARMKNRIGRIAHNSCSHCRCLSAWMFSRSAQSAVAVHLLS
jgi:hypothetical protein